jgi:polar amino acid transport system substrate-binding protein
MKRVVIAIVALSLLVGLVACGRQADAEGETTSIVVASDAAWPPMEFVNEDKEIVGFDIDLINAIGDAAGFEVEVRNTAWDGIFAGLATGEYDAVISSVTITADRQETMDFSEPYINAGQVLIVAQSTTGVDELADLAGEQVGAQIGTTGAFEIQKVDGVELATYDEIGLAVEDLANGRIAGVVADTPIAADYVLQNDEYSDTLQIVGEPFTEEYYGIAVQKGRDELLAMINEGLAEVKEAGLLEELEDKWLR